MTNENGRSHFVHAEQAASSIHTPETLSLGTINAEKLVDDVDDEDTLSLEDGSMLMLLELIADVRCRRRRGEGAGGAALLGPGHIRRRRHSAVGCVQGGGDGAALPASR